MLHLRIISKSDLRLRASMAKHYSQPLGFVGRSICFAVFWDTSYYGAIVSGSSTLYLPGRNEFFGVSKSDLHRIVNNIFFHIEPIDGSYPTRNFAQKCLALWRKETCKLWQLAYKIPLIGFESLVELPRLGTVYLRDGWTELGTTKGFTCKRTSGKGTDNWSGRRVWNTSELRPKRIFVKRNTEGASALLCSGKVGPAGLPDSCAMRQNVFRFAIRPFC